MKVWEAGNEGKIQTGVVDISAKEPLENVKIISVIS